MCAVLEISPKTYYKYRNKEDPDYYDYLIIKEIFDDSKEEILSKYNFGTPGPQLAKEYGISRFTIASWVRKQNHPELFVDKGNKRGRPKEKDLTKEDWKQRYEILKKYQAFLKAQREKK